jgi:protein O-GlcNAc transferase
MTNNDAPQNAAPQTIEQALQQAIAHLQAGEMRDAERLYRSILQSQPRHPDANHNLGVIAVLVGQPAAALPHFKAALEANPVHEQYWLSYIDTLTRTGQTASARLVLEQGRQRGFTGEEIKALAAELEKQVEGEPDAREINALLSLFSEGQHDAAFALAQEMTQRFPLYALGWKVTGTVASQAGRNSEALASMQQAAALSPGDAGVHYQLGKILQKLDRFAESEASYQIAIQIRPDYTEACYSLGVTLQSLGRFAEAEASYRCAIRLKPDYAAAYSNLGAVLQSLGQHAEAEASYRRAIEIDPDYAGAHNNLGVVLHSLGRLAEAEASYRRAIEIWPDYVEAHYNLGKILKVLGRFNEVLASPFGTLG